MTAVWIVLAVLAVAAAAWYAFVEDPHRVSRDGRSFDCRVRSVGDDDVPTGRWREARAAFAQDGLIVRRRTLGRYVGRMRRATSGYVVLDRREAGRYVIYLVEDTAQPDRRAFQLRIPLKSPVVERLDEMITP